MLNSLTSDKWKRIGVKRRAGVALPLFSVYSKNSVGIGEIPDLRILIDWCSSAGMSILQLLPLNELGGDFAPYNSISTFALEPMYLSISKLRKVDLKPFRKDLRDLKKNFPKGSERINYGIKNEKLELLRNIFETVDLSNLTKFQEYVAKNIHWLKYYAVFKKLTEINEGRNWYEWDLKHKYIAPVTSEKILHQYPDEINFRYWLQWQLYEQLVTIKNYARRKDVLIMGDLPFLISRNSSDVWAYKNYFKLNLSSGAPPDMYFSSGQRWGMPPYNWDNIAADDYVYLKQRLRYAENFFDMYRIDHFIGLFRVWTIDLKTPEEYGGLIGKFDPEDKSYWEQHGREILTVMNESSEILPCAEDLGTVPECSEKVLREFGITGMNVQRWEKKWRDNFNFLPAEDYRINSAAAVSTHDSSTLPAWWENEAGTVDEIAFERIFKKSNIPAERYHYCINELFENNRSVNGKLYWRRGIFNVFVLLNKLNTGYADAGKLIDIYLSSYAEKDKFWNYLGLKGELKNKPSVEFIKRSLEKINETASIFSIQLLIEYLFLDKNILEKYSGWNYRINFPGTVNKNNWSLVMPVSLEELKEMDINDTIKNIIRKSGRS